MIIVIIILQQKCLFVCGYYFKWLIYAVKVLTQFPHVLLLVSSCVTAPGGTVLLVAWSTPHWDWTYLKERQLLRLKCVYTMFLSIIVLPWYIFHIGLITVLCNTVTIITMSRLAMLILQVSGKYRSANYIYQLIFVTSRGRSLITGVPFEVLINLFISPFILICFVLTYWYFIYVWIASYCFLFLQTSFNFYPEHAEAELRLLSGRFDSNGITSLGAHWGVFQEATGYGNNTT